MKSIADFTDDFPQAERFVNRGDIARHARAAVKARSRFAVELADAEDQAAELAIHDEPHDHMDEYDARRRF